MSDIYLFHSSLGYKNICEKNVQIKLKNVVIISSLSNKQIVGLFLSRLKGRPIKSIKLKEIKNNSYDAKLTCCASAVSVDD